MTLAGFLGSAIAPPVLRDDEERALEVLDEVIAEVVAPLAPEHDNAGRYPTRAVNALKSCGILALSVPAEFGGIGASHTASLHAQVRLAAADSSVAQVYKVHDELVREIFSYCSDELKPRLASLVLEENAILGLAVAEAGRTVAEPFTTLALEQEDRGHLINGQKIYTTGSAEADYVAVWGFNPERFTPENPFFALQLNLVAKDTPGMTVHRDWDALGQRATDSGTISFENVQVGTRVVCQHPRAGAAAAFGCPVRGRFRGGERRHRHRCASGRGAVRQRAEPPVAIGRGGQCRRRSHGAADDGGVGRRSRGRP